MPWSRNVVFGGIHKWRHFPKIYTPSSLHSPHHPLFISNSYILRSPRKFEQSSSYLILTLLGGLLKRTLRLTGFLKFWTQPHWKMETSFMNGPFYEWCCHPADKLSIYGDLVWIEDNEIKQHLHKRLQSSLNSAVRLSSCTVKISFNSIFTSFYKEKMWLFIFKILYNYCMVHWHLFVCMSASAYSIFISNEACLKCNYVLSTAFWINKIVYILINLFFCKDIV